jgi:hypothetical protein
MTSNGSLRGESLIKSDLSDLCDMVVEGNSLDKAHIFVMRITSGKTNGLKTLYGRSMRHKDVTLVALGLWRYICSQGLSLAKKPSILVLTKHGST